MQIIPWNPCTETLVSSSRNRNQGAGNDTVKLKKPRQQYRNQDFTEYQYRPNTFFIQSKLFIIIFVCVFEKQWKID